LNKPAGVLNRHEARNTIKLAIEQALKDSKLLDTYLVKEKNEERTRRSDEANKAQAEALQQTKKN